MINKLKSWFSALPPDKKRKIIVVGSSVSVVLLIFGGVYALDNSQPVAAPAPKKKVQTSILTGGDQRKMGMEHISSENKRQESELAVLKRQVQVLMNQQSGSRGAGGPNLPFPYSNVDEAPQEGSLSSATGASPQKPITPLKSTSKVLQEPTPPAQESPQQPPVAGRSVDLPPPNIPGIKPTNNSDVYGAEPGVQDISSETPPPPPPKLKLRVLTPREGSAQNVSASKTALASSKLTRDPEFYAPIGTIFSGTLLTGVDAPASGSAAKKDPFPALFRIKHEAILPNNALLDLRECFIVASAYGDLSSERVYMRAEGLSCHRNDGAIIEATLDAYAAGGDGKAGIRGTVVEKTGSLIARSLVAGFVGGVAKSVKPTQTPSVITNPAGGAATFQYPDPSFVVGSGILGGGSAAAERIATIYEDLAKQIVPVIEVHAGIPVDFIMTRGASLRFKRVGDTPGQKFASSPPHTNSHSGANPQNTNESVSTSVSGTLGAPSYVTGSQGTFTPAPQPSGYSTIITGKK